MPWFTPVGCRSQYAGHGELHRSLLPVQRSSLVRLERLLSLTLPLFPNPKEDLGALATKKAHRAPTSNSPPIKARARGLRAVLNDANTLFGSQRQNLFIIATNESK